MIHALEERRLNVWPAFLLWALSMAVSACGPTAAVVSPPTAIVPPSPGVGGVATTHPSPTQEDPGARATRIAQHRQAILTQVAVSPVPTLAPYPPDAGPTPTLWLGMGSAPNGPGYRSDRPIYINSWRGMVDGHLLTIAAGQQSEDTDGEQGILVVYQGTRFDDHDPSTQVFLTPQRLGVVHIIAVEAGRVSLGRGPEQSTTPVFVFDLITRQWLPVTSPISDMTRCCRCSGGWGCAEVPCAVDL